MDELPANTFSVFSSNCNDTNELKLCASGILMVAEQQRQLIEQSLLSEVLPYERKQNDGE